ncbi:MAG: hypothetical protein AAGA10_17835, partial [Bacteroidota bacterium]
MDELISHNPNKYRFFNLSQDKSGLPVKTGPPDLGGVPFPRKGGEIKTAPNIFHISPAMLSYIPSHMA